MVSVSKPGGLARADDPAGRIDAQPLRGRVALVMGGGTEVSGLSNGAAAALLYARAGARVMVVDVDQEAALRTRALLVHDGHVCGHAVADVTRSAEVAAAVTGCAEAFGGIDVLHNNVGRAEPGGPVEASEESWNRVMALNVTSAFLACKHTLPIMERAGGGAIVNVSSIAAIRWSGVSYVSYYASKAALNQFTRAVALQYAAMRIRCNAVMPGLMDTPRVRGAHERRLGADAAREQMRLRDAQVPIGRMGDAWDVAHAALFLVSDAARFITGTILPVDGGMSCSMVAGGFAAQPTATGSPPGEVVR